MQPPKEADLMFKREEERAKPMGAAPSAFLHLSDEGALELDERPSPARRAAALLLAGMVLLAVPLFWVNSAQGADQPLAVKSGNSGSNSGPGSGDDNDDPDNSGPGNADDDDQDSVTATGTTANTGPSNTATNDTATGTHTGQGDGANGDDDGQNDDTTNGQQSNGTRENSVTHTAQTGDGPNTNTSD